MRFKALLSLSPFTCCLLCCVHGGGGGCMSDIRHDDYLVPILIGFLILSMCGILICDRNGRPALREIRAEDGEITQQGPSYCVPQWRL